MNINLNKSLFSLLVLLTIFSCATPKYKEFDPDYVKDFKNVKFVSVRHISYTDTKQDTSKIEQFYNDKNQLIKQIDYYKAYSIAYYFIYNNKDLVIKRTSKGNDSIYSGYWLYEYDTKNNLIRMANYSIKDSLGTEKRMEYDKKGNVTKELIKHSSTSKVTGSKLIYDYKNRFIKIADLDSSKQKNYRLILYFNKKGFPTKNEWINKSGDIYSMTKFSFDKSGMIERRETYKNDTLSYLSTYKNIYDSKGNVIERNFYLNGILKRKSLFYLTY